MKRLAMLLATGFGVGRLPVAPGTAGSLLGVGYWWLLTRWHNGYAYGAVVIVGSLVAVWCAGVVARILQDRDPACVVIDEIAAVPLALVGVDLDLRVWKVVAAFLLFRLFDIWKPWLVGQMERVPGGLGIVLDDLAAAVLAAVATQGLVLVQLILWP